MDTKCHNERSLTLLAVLKREIIKLQVIATHGRRKKHLGVSLTQVIQLLVVKY